MGKIVRKFVPDDWFAIKDPVDENKIPPDFNLIGNRCLAITVEDEEGVIGVGGILLYDEKNGELWLRLSRRASKFSALAAIRVGFKILLDGMEDMKIFCRVKSGFVKGERLVKWLGFKVVSENIYNDEKCIVYAL